MSSYLTSARGPRRLPVVVLVVAAVVAGVVAGRSHTERATAPVVAKDAAQLPASGALSTAWYCPGVPDAFATSDQTVTLSNLSARPSEAVLTVYPDDGSAAVVRTVTVAGDSLRTFTRSTLTAFGHPAPGGQEGGGKQAAGKPLSEKAKSTSLIPDGPLVVEPFSSDVVVSAGLESSAMLATVPCATTAGTDWYFAAGTTVRGALQWLVVDNPFAADARVDVTLRTDAGTLVLPSLTGLDVPARSRVVVPIHDEAVRRSRAAVEVHADLGQVVASQTLQFTSADGTPGVATSIGALAPASSWWFADGDTRRGASEWVAIADVGELDARVNVQVQLGTKTIVRPVSVTVPSGGVIWVEIGGCAASETAAASPTCVAVPDRTAYVLLVQSDADAPIVAQTLSRYSGAQGGTLGAATSMGSTAPALRWVIPRTRVTGERSTTIAVTNSGIDTAHVSVEVVYGGQVAQPSQWRRITVNSGERVSLQLGSVAALHRSAAALVVTSDGPVFAEWSIYAANDATRAPGIPAR